MLRKGGWRVYSKVRRNSRAMLPPRLDLELVLAVGRQVEWRGRGLAQLVSLYAERLAYFRRLCATEAEVATAVFRERVRSFLSGLWRQSRACKHAAACWLAGAPCQPHSESDGLATLGLQVRCSRLPRRGRCGCFNSAPLTDSLAKSSTPGPGSRCRVWAEGSWNWASRRERWARSRRNRTGKLRTRQPSPTRKRTLQPRRCSRSWLT